VSPEKPRRLGRGLDALIPGVATGTAPVPASDLQRVPLSRIRPNPFQPRREFDPADLAELEASLKATGLLQPITVRRQGDAYELIAGERRFRAATNLGWTEIPAIVRDFDDQTMLVLALVENLQRANLNAIEEARGYRRLLDDFKLTQQQIAESVGKDRTTVTNLLRILSLPDHVQQLVEKGTLSSGHARALLPLGSDQSVIRLADEAVAGRFTVRELEQRVRELSGGGKPDQTTRSRDPKTKPEPVPPEVRRIVDDLRRFLQTDVRLHVGADTKGRIEIAFYSNDDLGRVLDKILGERRQDF
jgi:ParB family transcriptional regulator, chromosome partitioning protein